MALRLELPDGPAVPAVALSFLLVGVITAGAGWLARHRGVRSATAVAALGSVLLVSALLMTADRLPGQRENRNLVAAAAAQLHAGTDFYCVDAYAQSVPFYLQRTCRLVGYRGELDFGLGQEPQRWIPDLEQFATHWRAAGDALAVIRPESYAQLRRMGLPMRVIYTAPTLVAVVRQ